MRQHPRPKIKKGPNLFGVAPSGGSVGELGAFGPIEIFLGTAAERTDLRLMSDARIQHRGRPLAPCELHLRF
jgi:hypothetical protein